MVEFLKTAFLTGRAIFTLGEQRRRLVINWAIIVGLVALPTVYNGLWPWAVAYPEEFIFPAKRLINIVVKWLIHDLDFGLFSFREMTRGFAWLLEQPLDFSKNFFVDGFEFATSDKGKFKIPAVSWVAVIAIVTLAAHFVKDWKLALILCCLFFYLLLFGQWQSAMLTLSFVVVVIPFGVVGGLLLGIYAYRHRRFEVLVTPVLDVMQTVPAFAYLTPVVTFFGFGPVAAMVATIIFAMPPMVRATLLGLKRVPLEIVEAGQMAGCTKRQMIRHVMVPSALPTIMVGVNQVAMLSLSMVIIASMIGAGGLGYDVLRALKSLAIGKGLEAGIAITILAITIDRMGQALANRSSKVQLARTRPFVLRHVRLSLAVMLIVGATAISFFVPFLETFPAGLTVTTGDFWDGIVSWVNLNLYDTISSIKSWIVINIMVPFKQFLLSLPWLGLTGALTFVGYRLGGWRLATIIALLSGFIVVVGLWEKTIITVYLMLISVAAAMVIGFPIGVWSARNEAVNRVVQVVIDVLQTLPSFVYLIPVVMLFSIGDFSAMIAIVMYSVVPSIRYTAHAIRNVPPLMTEVAQSIGCTRRQILWAVQLPLALPEIMLGVNQTIMMALAMLVITALIGTRDLGQEALLAMGRADTGMGLVTGLCVAFIAIISDRLIGAWANKQKLRLGLQ